MTRSSHPSDYYAATARSAPRRPGARGRIACGACVVGAGYTGLSAALHLRERGWDVVVIEARQVGWGASGRNGGQLLSGYAPNMVELVTWLGVDKARRLWALAERAKAEALARVAAWGVPHGRGWLAAATRERHLAGLEREAACWRDMGYRAVRIVDRDAVRHLVDSPLYVGGLVDEGAAHLHPLDYVRALAEAAEAAGVRIFEDTPARAVDAGGVTTPEARIAAPHVLLCGNADLGPLAPWLKPRLVAVTSYVGVTPPLGPGLAGRVLPADAAVADSRFIPDFFRRTPDHRLVFGSGAAYWRPRRDGRRMLTRRLHQVFPQLEGTGFESVWSGRIAVTPTRMPLIGRQAAGAWHACGFSGHGIALAGLAGRVLAEAVSGGTEDYALLAGLGEAPFPGGRLRVPLLAATMAWHRLTGQP